MKKKLFVGLILFIFFSTYKFKNDYNILKVFNIKKIEIENNQILDGSVIKKDLIFLYQKNIFSINEKEIKERIEKNNFIESFEIKKIYPSSIKIKIFEKKPIAILYDKKEKFFYTDKGDVIKYDHDGVYALNQEKLETMECFQKYGNYTSSNNIPTWAKAAQVD